VPTERVVRFGHQRWDLENYGFNELVHEWHADHLFTHDPNAIECLLLVAFPAYNLFHAFFALNLKPAVRRGTTQLFWARFMTGPTPLGGDSPHPATLEASAQLRWALPRLSLHWTGCRGLPVWSVHVTPPTVFSTPKKPCESHPFGSQP